MDTLGWPFLHLEWDFESRGMTVGAADFELLEDIYEGRKAPPETLMFERLDPGERLDVVPTDQATFLVSTDFLRVLERERATGWDAIPARIVVGRRHRDDDYRWLLPTGRCGPLDPSLAEAKLLAPPVPTGKCVRGFRGLMFPRESWDGADVFSPEGSRMLFVTDRLGAALRQADLSGMTLESIREVETPASMWPRFAL